MASKYYINPHLGVALTDCNEEIDVGCFGLREPLHKAYYIAGRPEEQRRSSCCGAILCPAATGGERRPQQ